MFLKEPSPKLLQPPSPNALRWMGMIPILMMLPASERLADDAWPERFHDAAVVA